MFLPVVDFLPYKKGNNIPELMKIPEGAPRDSFETKMIYEKNGKEQEFTMQNYPWQDSTWKWVRTENILIKEGFKPKVKDLRIADADGNDYTDDIILNPQYQLLVIAHDLTASHRGAFVKLDELAASLEKNNKIRTIGLTATNADQVEVLRHELGTPFDFYFCDATTLKTMVRSNPGVLLVRNGIIIGKWSYSSIPDDEDIQKIMNVN
jgi:hypothetical protein